MGSYVGRTFRSAMFAAFVALPGQEPPPPRILLDPPPRAVEYQIERLSNDEIVRLERSDADSKYRPVYFALLTRQGLAKEVRDEALAALVKLDRATAASVLLEAFARMKAADVQLGEKLVALLLAQPADALKAERAAFAKTIEESPSPFARRGAYGALMIADGNPDAGWQTAVAHPGHLADAMPALASVRPDVATFRLLAQEAVRGTDAEAQAAAVRALALIPDRAWPPAAELGPLAAALVARVTRAPPDARTEPAVLDAMHLAEKLSAALPDAPRLALRRDLRALGVRVIRIGTIPEQMSFDVRWFAVEAGKALQIVLTNTEAMPHNLIVGAPKSVEAIGTAAMTMGMPSDPAAKPFVPDSPLVLQATALLKEGDTARLSFNAPAQPGEYVFVCSYPSHWVRMYGVMLVVPDLEAWEAKPTVPNDPITNRSFDRKDQ